MTGAVINCYGEAAIGLENFTANYPVYYNGAVAPASGDIWIQVLGGAVDGAQTALTQPFNLIIDGFFDNGAGFVTGVADNVPVDLTVRGWKGAADGWATATETAQAILKNQASGKHPDPLAPATVVALNFPDKFDIAAPVPEPSTIALVLLGGAALLLRRRQ